MTCSRLHTYKNGRAESERKRADSKVYALIPNAILTPNNFPEEESKDSEAGLQFDKDCLSSGGRLDPKAAQAFP